MSKHKSNYINGNEYTIGAYISDDMSDNCMGYSLSMQNNIKAFNELYLDDEEEEEDYEEYR
jgi:hypothetical protein